MTRTTRTARPPAPEAAARLAAHAPADAPRAHRARGRRRALAGAAAAVLVALLAACSSGDDGAGGSSVEMARQDVAEEMDGVAADEAGDTSSTGEDDRQVVQTGDVYVAVADPHEAVRQVVALVERVEGRVDDRYERAGTEDDPGSARLTIRVPAGTVDEVTAELDQIGVVEELTISREDVTAAAEDLDARISATEVSVARMEDLLSRARTNADVIAAEEALTQRQSNLEQLRSERARVADRVALSTLHVELYPPAGTPVAQAGPRTFVDGLGSGWAGLVEAARATLVVVGVLLPWAAVVALVVVPVVLVRRSRRRRAAAAASTPGAPAVDPA